LLPERYTFKARSTKREEGGKGKIFEKRTFCGGDAVCHFLLKAIRSDVHKQMNSTNGEN